MTSSFNHSHVVHMGEKKYKGARCRWMNETRLSDTWVWNQIDSSGDI